MTQMSHRQVRQPPPPPFIRRQQVAPLPPRPVIRKRLPPLSENSNNICIVQRIQRFGIVQVDPRAYQARYGTSLLDSSTLIEQARSFGLIEDIVSDLLT